MSKTNSNTLRTPGISKKAVCWGFFLVLATPCLLQAQSDSPQDVQRACRIFVQGFYDWYLRKDATMDLALKEKRDAFSPELVRLLRDDRDAQSKAEGEIVGLDFDPFLNSQDPSKRYVAGKVTRKGESYWIEVWVSGSEKPVVWPELVSKGGRWLFVNFHYEKDPQNPMNENLLSILKVLRADRSKHQP
jgi:hypothetical protein